MWWENCHETQTNWNVKAKKINKKQKSHCTADCFNDITTICTIYSQYKVYDKGLHYVNNYNANIIHVHCDSKNCWVCKLLQLRHQSTHFYSFGKQYNAWPVLRLIWGKTPKNTDKYGPLEFLSTTAPATIRPFATDYEKKLAHAVTGLVLHHIFIHHQHCKKWK